MDIQRAELNETITLEILKEKLSAIIHSETSTTNNRKIADYLLTHLNTIAFMKASQIAEKVGVSQPAVTRFVTNILRIGGYTQFIKLIQDSVRNEMTGTDRYAMSFSNPQSNIQRTIYEEINNLQKIMEEVSEEKLKYIASQVAKAETVVILGFRTAMHLATYFQFFLNKIHPDVRLVLDGGSRVYDLLSKLDTEKTVVISLVLPRYPQEMIDVIQFLKQEKFNFFTVTDSHTLEKWGICECSIVTPIGMTTIFDSYITTKCLLNLLLDLIGREDQKRTKMMLSKLEKLFKDKQFFFRKE